MSDEADNAALLEETGALRLEISGLRMTIRQRDKRIEQLEAALRKARPWIARPHIAHTGRVELLTYIDAILAAQPPEAKG